MTKKLIVRFIILPVVAYLGYCATRGAVAGASGQLDKMTITERGKWYEDVASFRA